METAIGAEKGSPLLLRFCCVILMTGSSAVLFGQQAGDGLVRTEYIPGASLTGASGLIEMASPAVLPKGKFTISGSASAGFADSSSPFIGYSLGLGLSTYLEGYVHFASSDLFLRTPILRSGLRVSLVRPADDAASSVLIEGGFIRRDGTDAGGDKTSSFVVGATGGLNVASVEYVLSLGYAFGRSTADKGRIAWGAGARLSMGETWSWIAEASSREPVLGSSAVRMNTGIRAFVVEHLQVSVFGQAVSWGGRTTFGAAFSLCLSSAVFRIPEAGGGRTSSLPPLPGLEEVRRRARQSDEK